MSEEDLSAAESMFYVYNVEGVRDSSFIVDIDSSLPVSFTEDEP